MKRERRISPQEKRVQCVQGEWWRGEECNRPDIGNLWIHNTKIRIGGKYRGTYGPYVKEILESNFTPQEMERIGNLYIETNPKDLGENVGGSTEHFEIEGKAKAAIIRIPPHMQGDHKDVEGAEDSLTHENIHALRNVMGRYVRDLDREESETQLESISRMSEEGLENITTGYYQYIPGLKTPEDCFNAIDDDRILVNDEYSRKRKGDDAIHAVRTRYPKSNISRLRLEAGSDAENIDRYFLIGTPKKGLIRLHKRYRKGKIPPLETTKKRLQKRYGEDATIWEFNDGQKVKIGGNKTRKSTRKSYSSYMDSYSREMQKLRLF